MTAQLRAAKDQLIGNFLLGRYRVVRELAKGGMGVVYLARAEGAVGFVKPVVIKLLLPEHSQDDRFVRMFVREAQILSQLRHPSLVDVLEFGEEDNAYVLVLEYVRGYHLGQWLRYLSLKKREAPPEILVQIVVDVLDALHHAHNQVHPDGSPMQIVHRDVSPSNILLDEDGRARLLDFGVARMRGGTQEYKTQVDGLMGKLPYTAPEMFSGVDASPQSDLYACGVVLHEALLGRNVFRAEMQVATLQKIMTHVPEPVEGERPTMPAGLDAVLAKALGKTREVRHADAREFANALRKLQREQESDVRARLAALLKDDFGSEMSELLKIESLAHRDEAWRRLSQTPASTAQRSNGADSTAASSGPALPIVPAALGATVANSTTSRTIRRAQRTLPPPAPVLTQPPEKSEPEAAQAAEPAPAVQWSAPTSLPPTAAPASNPSRSQRGMLAALLVVGSLALSAIALSLHREPPPPVVAAPAIRVVSQAIAPPPQQVELQAVATATGLQVTQPEPPIRAGRKNDSVKHHGPDARALTQAFRKQQPKLEVCFKEHSVSLQGHPTAELDFDLDATGKLKHVELSPHALATTPLGDCVIRVARSTAFPAQGRAVSFAIPISARAP